MKTRDLVQMGIPAGACAGAAQRILQTTHTAKGSTAAVLSDLHRVADAPDEFVADPTYGELARLLVEHAASTQRFVPRDAPAPYKVWGENLEATALEQMKNACNLPVAAAGALMPDAHVGYGLPIGGVLATDEAVIPYAVGVDIACRMKMTVLDLPTRTLEDGQERLVKALERETRFGVGGSFKTRRQHDVTCVIHPHARRAVAAPEQGFQPICSDPGGAHCLPRFGRRALDEAGRSSWLRELWDRKILILRLRRQPAERAIRHITPVTAAASG